MLRGELCETLTKLWPGLNIVAVAEDGIEALDALQRCRPQVMFLDIEMPGLSGSRSRARRAGVVMSCS